MKDTSPFSVAALLLAVENTLSSQEVCCSALNTMLKTFSVFHVNRVKQVYLPLEAGGLLTFTPLRVTPPNIRWSSINSIDAK
jgi:hypothetical protein